ncbi:hypothetical protein MNEG_12132 [Monoraphidium neglectum]|uniref:Uncharacterized protein n=1 Tax=Monoraphidium neglectum TaxID=145388 RepID=A0A0D2LWG4_9CHLO|nr:hypothetical protein MNEG_12132 [Monoraphidium neglectum]KIY95829.1 hypothetical protein MNEG_12132 [Monoraphidium neglectum]|eukprot:XP_013894849.1 hypothetical protein MNEG_12132 [Monoraphidium neglectum]
MESSKSRFYELRKRRVLRVPDATKPLFVSGVTYRAGRFRWAKPCLLVVTSAAVFVLDVQSQGELEARDGSHASIQLALRASEARRGRPHAPLRAVERSAPSTAGGSAPLPPRGGAGGAALSIRACSPGPSISRAPSPFSPSFVRAGSPCSPSSARARAFGSLDGAFSRAAALTAAGNGSVHGGSAYGGSACGGSVCGDDDAASSCGGGGGGASGGGESVHRVDHCTITFDDAETARAAAGAIAYARGADADAARWLACGLPTSFSIELAGAAFEAPPRASTPPAPTPVPAAFALGPGPWGATVELPPVWCEHLSVAAAAGSETPLSRGASLAAAGRRTLSVPGAAPGRPSLCGAGADAGSCREAAALVVTFSTPLGLAAARVRPEHLLALLHDESADGVLAPPLNPYFSAAPASAAGRAPTPVGTGAGAAGPAAAAAQPCFLHRVRASVLPKNPAAAEAAAAQHGGAAGPSGAVEVEHSQCIYAVLQIALVKAPAPALAAAPSADLLAPAAQQQLPAAQPSLPSPVLDAPRAPQVSSAGRGWQQRQQQEQRQQRQQQQEERRSRWRAHASDLPRSFGPVVAALLVQAALLSGDDAQRAPLERLRAGLPPRVLLGALLLAALAALALDLLRRDAQSAAARKAAGAEGDALAKDRRQLQQQQQQQQQQQREAPCAEAPPAAPAPIPPTESRPAAAAQLAAPAAAARERWSVCIVGASLYTQPDAYIQAQVRDFKAAAAAAVAAAAAAAAATEAGAAATPCERSASSLVSCSGDDGDETEAEAAAEAGSSSAAGGAAEGHGTARRALPMLISDPEPSWITPDIHQRFIQAKSSLRASQDQAAATHQWRQRNGVDSVLERPPGPWYEAAPPIPLFPPANPLRSGSWA